ncbi:MAG TPA: DUF488 domain-containing protein [Chloroflexota bacterium]
MGSILHTIGASGKSLRQFAGLLRGAGVDAVVDVRLRNTSQLAGWSKRDDLAYGLELLGVEYEHRPELGPSDRLLDAFQRGLGFDEYAPAYRALIAERGVLPEALARLGRYQRPVLLCACPTPDRCHRRLLAEALAELDPGLRVRHL